ncbi:hypothetical protein F4805DRAFT_438294 [Annulohypoxylon moriforme]|nr:hypothetical protein F4805DRAFT_438294 [Annulohypoxylon moriforme]
MKTSAKKGDLETFGAALDSIGFWGASNLNPKNMQNNCVSVAVAHMEYYETVHELWKYIYGRDLPDRPLQFIDVLKLLGQTGWKYQWNRYSSKTNSDGKVKSAAAVMMENFRGPDYDELCLVLYYRYNGTGHAINMEFEVADWKSPVGFNFLDYQHSSEGSCDRKDLDTAKDIVVLYRAGPLDSTRAEELFAEQKKRKAKEMKKHGGYKTGRNPYS